MLNTEECPHLFLLELRIPSQRGHIIYLSTLSALQQLHGLGIVHGDINRYNILMTDEGPKFIDLEVSTVETSDDLKISELESLRGILSKEVRPCTAFRESYIDV